MSKAKNRIGETSIANNGQKITIIEYKNSQDINVQFDDNTIVKHKTYVCFKKGCIKNPNRPTIKKTNKTLESKRIGEVNKANNGQSMTIINYRNCCDIDVQFEDGVIVQHKNYQAFKNGMIKNPNASIIGTSIGETAILFYLKDVGFQKYHCGSLEHLGFGRLELDCFNPETKIAIEYDGPIHAYGENKERDKRKNALCKKAGIKLIRFKDYKLNSDDNQCVSYFISTIGLNQDFETKLQKCIKELGYKSIIVDFKKDKDDIFKLFYGNLKPPRLNESIISNTGRKMTIINYRGCNDIDVKFEDGTIVKHKDYQAFKRGSIAYPTHFKNKRIGETTHARNGQLMTITDYRDYYDIDIQFEDMTKVEHITYPAFKRGQIKNPNYDKAKYIGKTSVTKDGQKMTVIEYRNINDIDVRFEDGTIVRHKKYNNFKSGLIRNSNKTKSERLGTTNKARNGQIMTIIEYYNNDIIDVQFEDGTIVRHKTYNHFKDGGIANPNCPTTKGSNKTLRIKRVGETGVNNDGQKMTIIEYRNTEDIDIRFENGSIVKHKRYSDFRRGSITGSDCIPKILKNTRIGETKMANNGQMMTIINYNNATDISVQFEDKTIVKHKSYDNFTNGCIANPNCLTIKSSNKTLKIKRIGETKVNNSGQKMTIIAYHRSDNIDIEFEDGTIVKHKRYDLFLTGNIANPNHPATTILHETFKNKRIGETSKANNGQLMTVVDYRRYDDIDVLFDDGVVVKNKNYYNFKVGNIRNPNRFVTCSVS